MYGVEPQDVTGADVEASAARLFGHWLLLFTGGMALVALVAFSRGERDAATIFLLSALACTVGTSAMWMLPHRAIRRFPRPGLLVLMLIYLIAPAIAALPLLPLVPGLSFSDGYFEMASALTTTGATTLRGIDEMSAAVPLWRALVAAAGGFLSLVAALAIMAPLMIGGFEVDHYVESDEPTHMAARSFSGDALLRRGVVERALWATRMIALPYLGVAFLAALAIASSGLPFLDAVCLSLSAISTTGFTPADAGLTGYRSVTTEAILLLVMIPAAIGVTKHIRARRGHAGVYREDPELRYMGIAVGLVVALIFLRHWIGAIETRSTDELSAGIQALWGTFFMAVSFVTTTGFESASWDGATDWSGLRTPGVALIGLAIVGGGAASTAGGVKLVRAALLAKHSRSELLRLSRPSASLTIRSGGRTVGRDALRIVFVFAMLFFAALGAAALALAATGLPMVESLVAAISAVSNTGPLLPLLSGDRFVYTEFAPLAKLIFCAAMIVGRMETLAVVALLSPTVWRR